MDLQTLTNLNEIPERTFEWLNVNTITLESLSINKKKYNYKFFEDLNVEGLTLKTTNTSSLSTENYAGVCKNLLDYNLSNYNAGFTLLLQKNTYLKESIYITYKLDKDNDTLIDTNVINIEENSTAQIYINFYGQNNVGYHQSYTNISVAKNAKLKVIILQNTSNLTTNIQSILANVQSGGEVSFVLADIGAKDSIVNINVNLLGVGAKGNIHSFYLGEHTKKIDLNYSTNHFAENTISSSINKGVLLEETKKTFKGSIKFNKGSKGSNASLQEDVLVLSPLAKNSSIPLLLCTEDEVKGEHSASVGRLNEDILFYLMSRGLSESDSKNLLLHSYFNPILDFIEDDNLKTTLKDSLHRKVYKHE
jgi:FeS assembly protein SufD